MAPTLEELKARAEALKSVRAFFDTRSYLEVDPPMLSPAASIDVHIDPMVVHLDAGRRAYLHTSPEYAMKRLLAAHPCDMYFLGHVFRDNEEGPLHLPEFTMIEWYRIGIPYRAFIEETLDLMRLFLGDHLATTLTYEEAFEKNLHLNPLTALTATLASLVKHPQAISWDRDTLLQTLFTLHIEPQLQDLTVITDYPATQAALARTQGQTAERFEIYFRGIELANGFHELNNSIEQRRRLLHENEKRIALGKSPLPLDEPFLAALPHLPDCCGVAAGFDRLHLLARAPTNEQRALSPLLSTD